MVVTRMLLTCLVGASTCGLAQEVDSPFRLPPLNEVELGDWTQTAELPDVHWLARDPANIQFSATWMASGGWNRLGLTDVDVHRSWFLPVPLDWTWLAITPGFGFHSFQGGGELELPDSLFDLYVDVTWRVFEGERTALTAGFTPGLYGDFQRFDSRTLQWSGWILGELAWNPQWTVVGGVAYVRQLRTQILPIGGVIWTPSDDWRFEATIPRPRIARRLFHGPLGDWWGYVSGQFGGGAWAVADDAGPNLLLGYSDIRLLAGVEWLSQGRLTGTVEAGYAFARDVHVENVSLWSPEDTFLLQATLAF